MCNEIQGLRDQTLVLFGFYPLQPWLSLHNQQRLELHLNSHISSRKQQESNNLHIKNTQCKKQIYNWNNYKLTQITMQ
jgi:hypothetical protein